MSMSITKTVTRSAAKSLGKTLRAFQPTIREIQEVSSDFRATLEDEIGLDEIRKEVQEVKNTLNPNAPYESTITPGPGPAASTSTAEAKAPPADGKAPPADGKAPPADGKAPPATTSKDKVTEDMKAASAAAAWGDQAPPAPPAEPEVAAKVAEVLETAESGKLPNLAELDKVTFYTYIA
eukprot:gene6123-7346_t